ncbi:MAG: HAMP domain-containing histidine kinase [Sphingobacteriales bacterium]|nr:HAMP domain-containing histidine kinase [Sphingobacteriales bacterium]
MNIYTRKQRLKLALLLAAMLIGIGSLMYTNRLVQELSTEEKKKVELWAEATRQVSDIDSEPGDIGFALSVLTDNTTVPVILTDEFEHIISTRNLDSLQSTDSLYLKNELSEMKAQHAPIEIRFAGDQRNFIYYKDSIILTRLRYYPYFQLGVIALFLMVSYLAFSSSRKAEENQVWVGMAKETAHQLGTPLSSLMAWIEYLRSQPSPDENLVEIEKDVARLNTITERFSKIGSAPALRKENLTAVLDNAMTYIRNRSSSRIRFSLENQQAYDVEVPLNVPLFEWVVENLFKNAIDAMDGEGAISVRIADQSQFVYVDVSDTGKGIAKSKYKTVFKPGYTSKSRGWGLGLSLSKRIVEEYHGGQIFVRNSEPGKGTTFRIVLRKS